MNKDLIIKLSTSVKKTLPTNYSFNWYRLPNNVIIRQISNKFGNKFAFIVLFICSESNKQNISIPEAFDFAINNLRFLLYVKFDKTTNTYDCDECQGEGLKICDYCDEGRVNCANCSNTGEVECRECQGFGVNSTDNPCEYCEGQGETECESCGGDGYHYCRICDGHGQVNCNYCDSKGVIKTDNFFTPFKLNLIITPDSKYLNYFNLCDKENRPLDVSISNNDFFQQNVFAYTVDYEIEDNICYEIDPKYQENSYAVLNSLILDSNISISIGLNLTTFYFDLKSDIRILELISKKFIKKNG